MNTQHAALSTPHSTLADAGRILSAAERVLDAAFESARRTMDGGKAIDDHQVQAERLAYAATEQRAAREMVAYAAGLHDAGRPDALADSQALAYTAEVVHKLRAQIEGALEEFGVEEGLIERELGSSETRGVVRAGLSESRLSDIGRRIIEGRGVNQCDLGDEALELVRRSVRDFARSEVAPLAERIHRHDELVPDDLISKMAALGFFAASIPEEYGGSGMGYPAMIITTEELSAASLGAAGSLATRPEILAKALLAGGTEAQKRVWLPRIASGEIMVGIAVTEPDVGSDVASVATRAEPAEVGGRKGWLLNGAKAWSTFSGRANVLAVLARTDPNRASGARGLSLFIVEKEPAYGHAFEQRQPHGGVLAGTAIATPGYRGMHSFMLNFDNVFVPAENLVGEDGGINRGFYLQMGGFAAGRLQTGGRATGVSQAALEKTAAYVAERRQFGRPIGEYQLTRYKLGRMATHIAAGRLLTYAAARAMDVDENASMEGAMCKLLASDIAVWVTQAGQLIHGGWGYAEETAISRYVVDAQVLPIFEGVKPILELRVIARGLLGG
jgi:(2S)-methylsuccinyl-CoA dehydrogenase